MDAADAALLIWRFPVLENGRRPISSTVIAEMESSEELPAACGGNEAAAEETSIGAMIEEQIAKGYAEGWQRGWAEGTEKGYAEGVAAGTRAADEAAAAQAERLAAITATLNAPLPALEGIVEEAVIALALEVARCVIGNQTSTSRDYLVRLIREAVAKVPIEMGGLRLVMNPADLGLVRSLAPEIENANTALVGDDAVEPGNCLVVADGQGAPIKDMRWRPRTGSGMSQVDLSLAARWRSVMLVLFEGEDK